MNLDTNAILNHFASTLFSALTPPAKGAVYCVTIILQRSQLTNNDQFKCEIKSHVSSLVKILRFRSPGVSLMFI